MYDTVRRYVNCTHIHYTVNTIVFVCICNTYKIVFVCMCDNYLRHLYRVVVFFNLILRKSVSSSVIM